MIPGSNPGGTSRCKPRRFQDLRGFSFPRAEATGGPVPPWVPPATDSVGCRAIRTQDWTVSFEMQLARSDRESTGNGTFRT